MRKVICFDMDGTLANNHHRTHFVRSKPKNWPAFNAGLANDTVYEDIAWLLRFFYQAGCVILIVSARTEDMREATEAWLMKHSLFLHTKLYMRAEKDYREDSIVKMELLAQIRADGYEPFLVFDDRDRVVEAWRDAGIRCLQVQPGAF